jgi:hypothetical protein
MDNPLASSLLAEEMVQLSHYFPSGGPRKLFAAGVAKLYVSYPEENKWNETGLVGVWTFFANELQKTLHFQLIDIMTGSSFFTQELYENFQYIKSRPYFHTFESDECIIGISFAEELEGQAFFRKVEEVIEKKEYHLRPSVFKKAWTKFAVFGKGMSKQEKSKLKSCGASRGGHKAAVGEDVKISGPTHFRVDLHIGVDGDGKFGVKAADARAWLNMNPAWLTYFRELGLMETEINENAEVLLETTTEFLMKHGHVPSSSTTPSRPPPIPPRPDSNSLRRSLTRSREITEKLGVEQTNQSVVATPSTPATTTTSTGATGSDIGTDSADSSNPSSSATFSESQPEVDKSVPVAPPLPVPIPSVGRGVATPPPHFQFEPGKGTIPDPSVLGEGQRDSLRKALQDRLKEIGERMQDSDEDEEELNEEGDEWSREFGPGSFYLGRS